VEPQEALPDLWDRLLRDSDGLRRPVVLRAPLSTPLLSEIDFREILRSLGSEGIGAEPRIRAYVGGRHCDRLAALVRREPPRLQEPIEEWLARLSGEASAGLVINEAERWSDAVARRVARFVQPVLRRFWSPQIAVEVALFVGDYGYTPFGAHRDDDRHRSLHFHVGPCPKRFIVWDMAAYQALTGQSSNHLDPGAIASHGTPYEVASGDVFLLPPHNFHVGQTLGFSMDAAIILSKVTKKQALREAGEQALARLIAAEDDRSSSDFDAEPADYQTAHVAPETSLHGWMAEAVEELSLLRDSNAGLRFPGFVRHPVEADALTRAAVQLASPFRLHTRTRGASMTVYARHHRIQLRRSSAVSEMISLLDSGRAFRVADLARRFEQHLGGDAVIGLVSRLLEIGAVTVEEWK
jgi:hypothetical protein